MNNFQYYILSIAFTLSYSLMFSQNNPSFCLKSISKAEFDEAKTENFNATDISKIDSTKIEFGLKAIQPYYNEEERIHAVAEQTTPRTSTHFNAYYPKLKIYSYLIYDNHYAKACFVNQENELLTPNYRFLGTFGVMSKDGKWFGFKREGSDNIIDIEIIKITQKRVKGIMKLTLPALDVYENREGKTEIFWAKKNTIFMLVETNNYSKAYSKTNPKYYSLTFDY